MRSCSQRLVCASLMVLFGCSLAHCGLGKQADPKAKAKDEAKDEDGTQEQSEKKEEPSHRVAGEIVSVHQAERFVLIRRFSQGGDFADGDLVSSVSSTGATSSLKVTGERLGRLYAADIQEGTPAKGDLVTVRRLPESAKPASTPLPEAPQGGSGAFWEKNIAAPEL